MSYVCLGWPEASADDVKSLTNSGRMRKGEPRQSYLYALIDPKDEPYAIFKYQCRSSSKLGFLQCCWPRLKNFSLTF